MENDIFEEVRRIEALAEETLARAETDRKAALAKARADVERYHAESAEKLRTESQRLRDSHERELAGETERLETDFEEKTRRLSESAGSRIDALADRVVDRFLETHR
ncbi:MAG TPA: hypothetical protein VMX57_00180 [Planctomycetota bacterium]|nr:hypothetical protein [Planctomycetota bacterium]